MVMIGRVNSTDPSTDETTEKKDELWSLLMAAVCMRCAQIVGVRLKERRSADFGSPSAEASKHRAWRPAIQCNSPTVTTNNRVFD